ncbi:5'-nucleotidase C-terminal domain-containing protein [Thermohalobacter berrensis]|uniref:LysM domain-containing protein n=1 Tax=Thermohalobacter berrensis TaxID=99594 RepID=A0A419SXZ6_9FIRM|nr:5'-nucleotidase C-terminal domain-containing protein [Thermohalobacter berrensis]RKD30065.1 hypothetical protein BET03_05005 [Thermohalobacter berrensis]
MLKNSKKLSLFLAIIMVISIIVPLNLVSAEETETVKITVLGTTDIHGNIYDWSYEDGAEDDDVGLAKVYTIVKQVRKENPNTLLLDNGDTIQGTVLTDDLYNLNLDKPNPMMDVMNFMGYDAMTLGNHEFNFGLDLIHKMVKEANFPILSANIYNKEDGSNFVKPYLVKEIGGVKVGIIGLTTPNIPQWDGPKVTSLEFKPMAEEAKKYAKILKEEENVDIIIATAHAGLEGRHHPTGGDAVKNVINEVPEIEAILIGHDHMEIAEIMNGTAVGAADDKGHQVVRFDLTLKKSGDSWTVVDKKVELIETKGVEASLELKDYAKKYHESTLEFLKDPIGTSTGDFHPKAEIEGIPEAQVRDTAVIDLINNVQLKYTGADISAAALFKSSSNIEKGDVTYKDIFDIYKYPNTLYAVEVTGKELKDYMEWSAAYFNTYKPGDVTISFNPEIRGYNYDMFAGVEYKIDISKPAGQRIVDLKFNGKAVKDDQVFKLAINNYRYGGLKSLGIISNEPYFKSDPVSLRSYIAEYIKEKGTIEPEVDNNWEIVGADLNHPLRDEIIDMVNSGKLKIPTSKDGRTPNVRSLNVYELIAEGKIPQEILEENNIKATPITIAHTNDTHARVEEGKYAGMGFAKIATKVKELKKKTPNLLLLDAGDTLHGQTIASLSRGESIIEILNSIGYDAMVPGNHDFNYGQERLTELSNKAKFPIVAANIEKEDGSKFLKPYTIKELNGVKVGIFGLATPETTYKTHPNNVKGLKFTDPVKAAEEMVQELKDKVDIVVALSHLGLDKSSKYTSELVASKVDGIDIIVDGHSHTSLPNGKLVNDTLIVQTGEYDKNLGIVNLVYEDGKIVYKSAKLFTKADAKDLEEDKDILSVVTSIKEENNKILSVVIGETNKKLIGERQFVRTGETNLGNLIADAMLEVSGADVALTNGGGIRASIEPGKITKGDIITVLPFGNYVVVKEMKGSDIIAALEHGISAYPETLGAFPHVAGMEFVFDPSKEAGNRIVEVKIDGKPINPDKTYKVATNDFLAAGGDNYTMFKDDKIVAEYPGLDEVVMNYIKKYGTEGAKIDGRVKVYEEETKPVTEIYIVRPNDVLWKIANKFGLTWQKIANFNKLENPNLIFPGQKILIPVK